MTKLHEVRTDVWKIREWKEEVTQSILIALPMTDYSFECDNYITIALVLHAIKCILHLGLNGRKALYSLLSLDVEIPGGKMHF